METVLMIVGILLVLGLAAFFAVLTCKSKHSDLFRWVGIAFFVAFLLTWIIPYGTFSGSEFVEYGLNRLGISNVPTILANALYFCLSTVVLLLVTGGFYGVLGKTKSYQKLVTKFGGFVERHRIVCAIVTMVLLILLTSVLKSVFCLVIFLPFIASVFMKGNTDKVSAMGITFGSVLVGELAATWGTDGLYYFNTYLSITDNTGLGLRAIIGGCALILFVLFNVFRLQDIDKKAVPAPKKKGRKAAAKEDESVVAEVKSEELFAVEGDGRGAKLWTSIVALSVLAVLVILGFFDWETNLGVTIFSDFFSWLTGLTIGEDFTPFAYILGSDALALGSMQITSLISMLLIVSIIYGLMEGLSFNEYISGFGEGFVKFVKPTALYVLTYAIFVIMYLTPYMAYINSVLMTDEFNPYLVTVTSFITNLFHADLGYTGYLVGTAYNAMYADNFSLIHTIFVTTYGLVQLFMPTGGVLLIGLSYFKLDYKEWFKYIWLFVVAILFVLLIVATIVTYIM